MKHGVGWAEPHAAEWHPACSASDELPVSFGARNCFNFVFRKKAKKVQVRFMAAKAQHEYAVYLFQQKLYEDAVKHLDEALREEETGERWSDWATAQFGLDHFAEAERGFRRALELDPGMSDAAVNFGIMLSSQARFKEALELFELALPALEGEGRITVQNFIQQCRTQLGSASPRPTRKKQPGKARKTKAKR